MGRLVALATGTVSKAGFAQRDQNSSPATSTTMRKPEGPGVRPTLNARSGYASGRTRGVGRHLDRDQNSSPTVTRVQPRTPDGKYASHDNDLKVIHPLRGTGLKRASRTSSLHIARKGGDAASKPWVEKAASLAGDRKNTRFGMMGQRGRRLF